MARKSKVTQELANAFPEWTKVRGDDQSVGQSFLNTIGLGMELLITEMFRAQKSQFLTTAFMGEIDQTFNVQLPNSFEFTVDSKEALSPVISNPTLSGLIDVTWYPVSVVEDGSLRSFWYDAIPTRVSEVEQFTTNSLLIASGMSSDIDLTVVNSGLFLDNRLTVVVDGDQLLGVDNNNLLKSKVRITGTTWKDTEETEDIVFLFSESRNSFKAWNSINRVQPVNFVSESSIDIYSHQFNQPYYLDSFEVLSQFSTGRDNLPLFWTLETSVGGDSILQALKYTTNNATDLIRAKPVIAEYRNWELLDDTDNTILVNDIVPVPNQQRIYAIDSSRLFVYDTFLELPDVKQLDLRTPNGLIDLEISHDYLIRAQETEVAALFKRPIKTIIKHRISIKYPDGLVFGILPDGTVVPDTTDYWVNKEITDRLIRQPIFVELDDFGQHIFTLEVVYLDQTTEYAQRAVLVQSKSPLIQLDLSDITTTASGIDIDHQNRLLILDADKTVHHIQLHYDLALVDFDNKQLIFREDYNQVKVIK